MAQWQPAPPGAKSGTWVWWAVGAIVAIVAAAFLLYPKRLPEPTPPPQAASAPPPSVEPEAAPPAPSPPPVAESAPVAAAPAPALPALDESDHAVLSAAMEQLGQSAVQRFVVPEAIIRHIVVTVDNLPRQRVPVQTRPIEPTPGSFATSGGEDAPVLDAANFLRYQPFVALVDAADAGSLVALYRRFYPLFDEAYQSLGNGDGDFNARLENVIEHLLAAPERSGPIALARPNVMFTYADPELEALSAGQKLMIRIGIENERTVKRKLREILAALR